MSVATKERPVLFSGEMVRAILSGRKTQTRRIVKGGLGRKPNWACSFGRNQSGLYVWSGENPRGSSQFADAWPRPGLACPFGQVGDRMWVRESWTPDHAAFYPHHAVVYRADGGFDYERKDGKVYSPEADRWFPYRWRP
ncbi:MAG: hypothetical protein AAFU85_33735, partial [Planctomycetota bacterium]